MKIHSTVFVLFLFTFTFLSTRTWAQASSVQPKEELAASQDARWLGEEIQRNQPVISEALKADNRSTDAMHWTAISVNQQIQSSLLVSKQSIGNPKVVPARISSYKQVDKPNTAVGKPVNHSL